MDYKTISNKNSISRKSIILIILGVSSISLFLRIYITPFEIPLSLDALEYYAFGYEIAISMFGEEKGLILFPIAILKIA